MCIRDRPARAKTFCNGTELVDAIKIAPEKKKSVTFRLDVRFRDEVKVCEYYDSEYEFRAKTRGKSKITCFFSCIFRNCRNFKNDNGHVLQDRTFLTISFERLLSEILQSTKLL